MLRRRDAAAAAPATNLHVLFPDGAHAYVGASVAPWASRWTMGIPRLRMPGGAPSRSTLKLAEAFVTFLGDREPEVLRAGMRAVDLGAAPGGWTWQLARRGLRVTAVDNGPLKGDVARRSARHPFARGWSFVPAEASGRLDGLRHRRTAGADRGARRPLDRRRSRAARDLQPEAADEEALRRGARCEAIIARPCASPRAAHAGAAPALPRPRGSHRIHRANRSGIQGLQVPRIKSDAMMCPRKGPILGPDRAVRLAVRRHNVLRRN